MKKKKHVIPVTTTTPDVEKHSEEIDLNILGKSDEEIVRELDKSEIQTAFVAIVAQLEKQERHDEAANLNRKFARLGQHQLVQRQDLLKPYANLLE